MPPRRPYGRYAQTFRFVSNPLGSSLAARRDFGDVWQLHLLSRREPFVATCHPDHVRSLFTAAPDDAPSLTGESPLRPIVGPNSVLSGGIRRCLDATLAMAEQRVVLRAIATHTDLAAPDPTPERARQRNLTMILDRGGHVLVVSKRRK